MGKKGKGRRRDGELRARQQATLATRLSSVAIHLLRRLGREDAGTGVSAARLSALSVLVFGGPHSLGELAAAEDITPPSMTRLVAALEAEGLIERHRSTVDGRRIVIRATPAGEELLLPGRDRRLETLAGWLGDASGKELDGLDSSLDLLERVVVAARVRNEADG